MEKTGVFVVDSDVVMRQVLVRLIRHDPLMRVAGVASTAVEAVGILGDTATDVVVLELDTEDGALPDKVGVIRAARPDLPIIGLCRRSHAETGVVLGALGLGIDDFLTKPETRNGVVFAANHFSKRLGPMVRALVPPRSGVSEARVSSDRTAGSPVRTSAPKLVVVGAGTGGPKALFSFLAGVPASFPVPILIAQHLPRGMTTALARGLDEVCAAPVREAVEGRRIRPGTVWLAPGGRHLVVVRQGRELLISVHRGPRENRSRPSIDVLFRSAVDALGGQVAAVMLSGYGWDGVEQSRAIKAAGGSLLVQDRTSALVWELPDRVAEATGADEVPIERMAEALGSLFRQAERTRGAPAGRAAWSGVRGLGGTRVNR